MLLSFQIFGDFFPIIFLLLYDIIIVREHTCIWQFFKFFEVCFIVHDMGSPGIRPWELAKHV